MVAAIWEGSGRAASNWPAEMAEIEAVYEMNDVNVMTAEYISMNRY